MCVFMLAVCKDVCKGKEACRYHRAGTRFVSRDSYGTRNGTLVGKLAVRYVRL